MNGWQRLFVVVAVIVCLPPLAIWLSDRPRENQAFFVMGCVTSYYTPKEAEIALRDHSYEQESYSSFQCGTELTDIAQGTAHSEAVARWWDAFRIGGAFLAAGLAILYTLGAALGWVWRGFRPNKTA